MRTIIIENSLCDSSFVENVCPDDILRYMAELHKCGVEYIEMTTDAFIILPPGSDCSKIILRVTNERDLLYVNSFNFAYVLLPANLTHYAPKLCRPVITELCLHGSNPEKVINIFEQSFSMENVSIIRLVDDFDSRLPAMIWLIENMRKKYPQIIDICPTNNKCNAISAVISAVIAHSGSVTLRFGSSDKFAELVDYTRTLANMYGMIPSPDVLKSLFICDLLYRSIYGRNTSCVMTEMREKNIYPTRIFNADKINDQSRANPPYYHISKDIPKTYQAPLYKKLRSMSIDRDSAKELEAVIDSFSGKLYRN